VVLLVALLSMGWGAGACTRCEIDCHGVVDMQEVVAEVRSVGDGIANVRTEAGDSLDIRVYGGDVEALERGTSYRFPLLLPPPPEPEVLADGTVLPPEVAVEALPEAFFPDDCDCTLQFISDLDGDVVDPGLDIPFRRYALSFIALSMLATMGWALARWHKGVPL
jgi:hypothetical protein